MNQNWNDLEIFSVVAALSSFTRAAEKLNQPKANISRAVSALEKRLGMRLIERSTRRLHLTDSGRAIFDQVRPLFGQLHDIVEEALSQQGRPQGVLRVSTPFEFGILQLSKVVCATLERFPEFEIDVDMASEARQLVAENYDLVFSMQAAPPNATNIVQRSVLHLNTVLCAAPKIVERFGMPQHPAELSRWPCLCDELETVWRLTEAGRQHSEEVRVSGRLRTLNASLRLEAAEAGIGAAILAETLCREALRQGSLVRLLPGYRTPPRPVYVFMRSGQLRPARIRVFLDELARQSEAQGYSASDISPLRTR